MIDPRTGWPTETSILSLIKPWASQRAFEVPLAAHSGRAMGNHGDALMHRVYRAIATEAGYSFVDDVRRAEVLVLPPNGALIDTYSFPRILRERLTEYPDIPLVMFPSSALFRSLDPAGLFEGRSAPTLWILREAHSHSHLGEKWSESLRRTRITLALDHDVVASGHERVPAILREAAPHARASVTTLVAARLDVEARSLGETAPQLSHFRRTLVAGYLRLPVAVQRRVRRQITGTRQKHANAEIVGRVNADGDGQQVSLDTVSTGSMDISSPGLVSFSEYAAAIVSHRTVVTNRLHVALPSAALGNITYLVDSGYHKLRGVYEQSLRDVPNITLVSRL